MVFFNYQTQDLTVESGLVRSFIPRGKLFSKLASNKVSFFYNLHDYLKAIR